MVDCSAWPPIHKHPDPDEPPANLPDDPAVNVRFGWLAARGAMDGLPGGGLNIAYEAVDRHVAHGHGKRLALRWLGRDDTVRDFTYADLAQATSRFADVLARLGVGPGARVFALLHRVPDLYVAALGTLKRGAVFAPLYSVFGPEPVRQRMTLGNADVLVTTAALYRKKIAPWRDDLPSLRHVLLVDEDAPPEGCLDLPTAMAEADPQRRCCRTLAEDMALLHFTSGTTGKPKGAVHVHDAVVAHHMTGRCALDLHERDVFWCTADPGWVTGMSYGIISPLTNGVTMIVDEAEFDAERWYRILEGQRVSVWYTAPTAIRMLMKAGADLARQHDLSPLRFLASVGEPLNPEAVIWGQQTFGRPFHDTWWQTETGAIMIANTAAAPVKPGSMGRPLPGVRAGILTHAKGTAPTEINSPMTVGELALKAGWPSMFRGYLNNEARYRRAFAGDWYLTGDLAMRDADGYFWFVGRADDVIKSAGHLIGPFEVESTLLEHPAVAEAGVIGMPDATMGEAVKAFVTLKPGFAASDKLRKDLLAHARKRLGPSVAPRAIDFRAQLPRTRSGKIMRRLLKARELGLPEGDTSTLEESAS